MQLKNADVAFAVLDVETTGFAPSRDRVIELAIVRVRPDGRKLDEYCTLINPDRDVGPTYIHGISASDVSAAPSFADVLGDIAVLLRGTIVVGHNLRFDLGFLREEAARASYALPLVPALCTLALSHRLGLDLPRRKLHVCCEHAGIEVLDAHSALGDAIATSKLLLHYLERAHGMGLSTLEALGCQDESGLAEEWPPRSGVGRVLRRAAAAAGVDEGVFIRRLLQRLESAPDVEAGIAAYFDVLDRVLEDRRVTDDETEALYETARLWSLKPEDVRRAHRRYLRAVVDAALGDGIITPAEQTDLIKVARLLGFGLETLDGVRAEAQASCAVAVQLAASVSQSPPHQLVGKSICFTGALTGKVDGARITRLMAESLVSTAGLLVRDTVTKGLDILVVADPNTQSSKAKNARAYGTRVLAETELWRLLGVAVS